MVEYLSNDLTDLPEGGGRTLREAALVNRTSQASFGPTGFDQPRGEGVIDSIPSGPFGVILADPPWAFKTWSGKHATPHRTANDHYLTRKVSALAELPVLASAARDCVLFMWVVDSHIDEAIELGKAWGFKFKTRAFTWRKLTKDGSRARISMGYWTRKQSEICLLFTRGSPKRLSKGVREIIDAPIREHSRKPDEQYERIEALVAGPYLELFARQGRGAFHSGGATASVHSLHSADLADEGREDHA